MKRPARFTQAEIERALRAALKLGMTIEVREDGIKIVPKDEGKPKPVGSMKEIIL